jgi:tetratricopeptide (TPR) repeat protein
VFQGDFDLSAAGAVWDMDAEAAGAALGEVLRYSLVEYDARAERYRLHDLARPVALGLLGTDEGEARDAHARRYLGVLREAVSAFGRGGEARRTALALFDLEQRNIEAGQSWAAAQVGVTEMGTRLSIEYAVVGGGLIRLRLPPATQLRWMEAGLESARRAGRTDVEALILVAVAEIWDDVGDTQRVIDVTEQALGGLPQIGNRVREGIALSLLGRAYLDIGEVERGQALLEQALAILGPALATITEAGDRDGVKSNMALVMVSLADSFEARGDTVRAVEYEAQGFGLADEVFDGMLIRYHPGGLQTWYQHFEEGAGNVEGLEQALALAREWKLPSGEVGALVQLAIHHAKHEDGRRAREYLEQALAIARDRGEETLTGSLLDGVASTYEALGEHRKAVAYFEQAVANARAVKNRALEGRLLFNLGLAYSSLGEPERAAAMLERSIEIAVLAGNRGREGTRTEALAEVYRVLRRLDEALALCNKALMIAREVASTQAEASALASRAEIQAARGEAAEARADAALALELLGAADDSEARTVRRDAQAVLAALDAAESTVEAEPEAPD